jgi:hypothetical protein
MPEGGIWDKSQVPGGTEGQEPPIGLATVTVLLSTGEGDLTHVAPPGPVAVRLPPGLPPV